MKILLADDERELVNAEAAILRKSGYEVDTVYNGGDAYSAARDGAYDCCIFDIMMPVMSGIEALEKLRAAGDNTPVLLLTAKTEVSDRIKGLDAGADDYLTKPFSMGELLARVRAMTRRAGSFSPDVLRYGDISLDRNTSELNGERSSFRLGTKEFGVAEYLIRNAGKTLETRRIFDRVWSEEPDTDAGVVFVYISYLRSKLSSLGSCVVIDGSDSEGYTLR